MNELTTITRTRRPEARPLRVYLVGKIAHGVPWRCEALGGFKFEELSSPTAGDEGSARAFSFGNEQGYEHRPQAAGLAP